MHAIKPLSNLQLYNCSCCIVFVALRQHLTRRWCEAAGTKARGAVVATKQHCSHHSAPTWQTDLQLVLLTPLTQQCWSVTGSSVLLTNVLLSAVCWHYISSIAELSPALDGDCRDRVTVLDPVM